MPGEHGKAHFESRFSATKEFRPSCKIIPHMDRCPEDVVIPKRGPQLHTLKFTSYNPYRDRRHLTDKDLTRIDSSLISNGKKIVMMDDRHQRSQFRSSEGSMETTFNRKQRVDIDSRRNGVGVAHAGDKSYKTPEHAPGYFKDGGLISGSSIRPRPERGLKSCEQTDTASKSIRSLTAHEKREIDTFESDRRQVEILTVMLIQSPPSHCHPPLHITSTHILVAYSHTFTIKDARSSHMFNFYLCLPPPICRNLTSNEVKRCLVGRRELVCGYVNLRMTRSNKSKTLFSL